MANIIFLPARESDAGTVEASSEISTLPASNLLTSEPAKVWRSDAAVSAVTVTLDFGRMRAFDRAVLAGVNFTSAASITIEAGESEAELAAPPFTYGPILPLSAAHVVGDDWSLDMDFTTGDYTAYEAFLTDATRGIVDLPLGATWYARFVRITITDADNVDEYLEAARLIVGATFQPIYNPAFGMDVGRNDFGAQSQSPFGPVFTADGERPRGSKMTFEEISKPDLDAFWLEFDRRIGRHGDFYFNSDPDETARVQELGYVAVATELGRPMSIPKFDTYGHTWARTLTVQERV